MELSCLSDSGFSIKTKTGLLEINKIGHIEIKKDNESVHIAGPGEYEAKGFSVTGFQNGSYFIEAEDVRLGYLTGKEEVDILLTDSWETAKEIQPGIVIPATSVAEAVLAKASGLEAKKEKKLVVNKLSLPEETELIILEHKN